MRVKSILNDVRRKSFTYCILTYCITGVYLLYTPYLFLAQYCILNYLFMVAYTNGSIFRHARTRTQIQSQQYTVTCIFPLLIISRLHAFNLLFRPMVNEFPPFVRSNTQSLRRFLSSSSFVILFVHLCLGLPLFFLQSSFLHSFLTFWRNCLLFVSHGITSSDVTTVFSLLD